MIKEWEAGKHGVSDFYKPFFAAIFEIDEYTLFAPEYSHPKAANHANVTHIDDIHQTIAWISGSNTSDDAIEQTARASIYLTKVHTEIPAKKVLAEVLGLHRQTQELLRSGKQRFRQTRELLRIESDLLAHACLLLGDLGQDQKAADYGSAALIFAQEAGSNEAKAWSVQSKTARWQNRYVKSAELASRGFEVSTQTPTRVELAYREANAIALFGDGDRARRALQRAQDAAEDLRERSYGDRTVWSFPIERQAVFALSVAIYTGDADGALRAAEMADACWVNGHDGAVANWAQIRAGAGIAYLMKGALDGVIKEISPILKVAPELRISTITRYLDKFDNLLHRSPLASASLAVQLSREIQTFKEAAPVEIK